MLRDQLSSWSNDENKRDCCKWRGVHCHNRTNHVTRLNFGGHVRGKISPSLLELQHLRYLDLSFNDFELAPIPELIGSLSELRYLNLAACDFSGPIPQRLGNLSKLLYLDLHDVFHCYSENLDWLSSHSSLEYADLSTINLTMAHNWLQAISKLGYIKELHLAFTDVPEIPLSLLPKINGSTPLAILDLSRNWYLSTPFTLIRWFSNFSTGLTSVNLNGNRMSSPIPDIFEDMISLENLNLGKNNLEGGVPKYLGNLSSLRGLYLHDNKFTREFIELMMNLSGPVAKTLEYLDLRRNSISGLFPNMSRFSSLSELKLQENQLSGSIQDGYLQLPSLTLLHLSSNQFTGPVPDLSSLSSLKQLSLDNNMFNGTLTESIGRLYKLEVLWIGSNLVEGIITEPHLFNLSRLEILDLP
ncbi:Receptor-like protein EIX1 [Sesamum alatum]|uniref:Receptor-like protein EIX1 n=1 Tax=Sesamum alatum TaxID=300844 RepID=A0AAE2CBZ5_9LAMI|nr:Receptor-like protein EIX1 [Sesamum alatum]